MTITIIILLLTALSSLIIYSIYNKNKNSKPLHTELKDKLFDDLRYFEFSREWEKRQECNLRLLWLNNLEKQRKIDFEKYQFVEENTNISSLTMDELRYPQKWEINNVEHVQFVQKIIGEYGEVLANSEYKGFYKPEYILPYPKRIIIKSIYFILDFLNHDNPTTDIEKKTEYANNLNGLKVILSLYFVNTGNESLPEEAEANYRIGRRLKLEDNQEIDELNLIDWRDHDLWLKHGINYAQSGNFDLAIKCCEKARELNQSSKNLNLFEGELFLDIANSYLDKDDFDSAINHFEKSADLGNLDAKSWLEKHSHLL